MKKRISISAIVIGVVTLVVVYLLTRGAVKRFRPPGAMTVIEAQAMDMNAMSANTPVGSIPVATEEAVLRPFAPTVTCTGSVVAFNDSAVYPRVTGQLIELSVYPGDRVHAGQIVARLDSAELNSKANEAATARVAAGHDVMIATLEQQMAAAQKRSVQSKATASQRALQDAQTQVMSADAMRDQSEHELEAAQSSLADARAGVTAAQADADYWKAEIAREGDLFQAKAVTLEEFDREKTQGKTADAMLAQSLAEVEEKKALIGAAKAKVQLAGANIVGAQARLELTRAAIQGARADVAAAEINTETYTHRIKHMGAMVDQATARERTADIIRGYTEIRAAEDGVVTERLVSPGTLVQPGTAILKIKSDARVRLQANVSEVDLANIVVGSAVTVTKPRDPRFQLRTQVTSLFNSANLQTRTVIVEALTPNPDGRLLPGEYIVMQIATAAPRRAITVPMEAVRKDADQKPFVWTLAIATDMGGKTLYTCVMHPQIISDKPGKCPICGMDLTPKIKSGKFTAHRVYVTLGRSDGNRIVVEQGLQEGQQILTRGYENLNEGDPITPVEWGVNGPKSLPDASAGMSSMPGMDMGSKSDGTMDGMKMDGK